MVHWILQFQFGFFIRGFFMVFYACLLEGKRVPTFPGRLCRRRQSQSLAVPRLTGLQFTHTLGKALALLAKHGLEIKRQKEFPVEIVMESLLSKSPLMVAAAPDMGLTSSIDHFLSNCASDEKDMPIGKMLRAGSTHVLDAYDGPELSRVIDKCLQWARDPDRPPIANTTVDEAAAIQLYTQHTCLYG